MPLARQMNMQRYRRSVAILLVLLSLGGCGAEEPPADESLRPDSEGALSALVRVGDTDPVPFVADEVVASLNPTDRERELVIYARTYDLSETLAFVVDLDNANVPGLVDLSNHGVLYLEPGFGLGGADLIFDGEPEGMLELDGTPAPGGTLTGRFVVTIPGYDTARPSEELLAVLEGSLVIPVESIQP